MSTQSRTSTGYERIILTWMKGHTHNISITRIAHVFGINREESEYMINIHKLNPGSDFTTIRTV